MVLPALQLLGDAGQVICRDRAIAQGELPGGAVREDLDGVDLAQFGQFGADGSQGIGFAVDDKQADVAVEVFGQLAGLFDTGIDDQQLARLAALAGLGMIGRRLGGVLIILALMVHGDGGCTIEQYAWLQGQHLLMGSKNCR